MTVVVGSFLFLIGYLLNGLLRTQPPAKALEDPLEALLQQPPESLPNPEKTGHGLQLAKKEPVPVAPTQELAPEVNPTDAAIRAAFFPKAEPVKESNPSADPEKLASDEKKVLEQNEQQLENIERELSQLPGGPESAPARAILLHSASTLDLDEKGSDEVHELAMDELLQAGENQRVQAADEGSSFAYFLPVVAHEIALKTALDSSEAMNITIDGMLVHQDPGIRYSLVRNFISRYPELEPQLREELFVRNINTLPQFTSQQQPSLDRPLINPQTAEAQVNPEVNLQQ